MSQNALEKLIADLPARLTIAEAAKHLGVSDRVLRTAIASPDLDERLPALRMGKSFVIFRQDLATWLRAHYTGPVDGAVRTAGEDS